MRSMVRRQDERGDKSTLLAYCIDHIIRMYQSDKSNCCSIRFLGDHCVLFLESTCLVVTNVFFLNLRRRVAC